MKKLKFVITMLLVTIFLMCSVGCGSNGDITGRYTFLLGKATSKHLGIYMDLFNTKYETEVEELQKKNPKKYRLTLDVGSMTDVNEILAEAEITIDEKLEKEISTIEGYYYIDELATKEGRKMNIGVTVIDDKFFGKKIVIPSAYVELVLLMELDGTTLNIIIPVSSKDLTFQLYWYGYDVLNEVKLPQERHHALGTHPTKEQVEEINSKYEYSKTHTDPDTGEALEYRDYHTLTMGLLKEI